MKISSAGQQLVAAPVHTTRYGKQEAGREPLRNDTLDSVTLLGNDHDQTGRATGVNADHAA